MKVLFIGGTGLISTAVSKLAVEKGFELYLLNRGQRNEFVPAGANVIQGDIRNLKEVSEVLKGFEFDVVVNWIGFVPEEVENDISLFSGRISQYIYISSASAYQKPSTHYLITESTPLVNPHWDYSRNKIACEERLMQEHRKNGFPVTIVRPSFTFGDTMIPASLNSWNHPYSLVDRMKKGKKIIVHGDGSSLWTMTHNTDFAKGFVGLMGNSQAIGHPFHITSDEVLTWDQIYRAIGRAAGVVPNIVHIPSDFIIAFAPDLEGNLIGDKSVSAVFDNSKIKRFVPDFLSTTSFEKGIRQTVAWFEAHPERCTIDEEWNALMDRIIAAYEKGLSLASQA
ncbi:MAG: SDR family oxidoreductase [Clostridia bacterium]|nr:SDR family oxidoreductase [Clostridia bacterium]